MCFDRFLFTTFVTPFSNAYDGEQLCNGVHGAAHKMESMRELESLGQGYPQIGSLSNMRKEESRTREDHQPASHSWELLIFLLFVLKHRHGSWD